MIENADDLIERINPSGPVSPEGSEDRGEYQGTIRAGTQFIHLATADREGRTEARLDGKTDVRMRSTRYMTSLGQEQKPTIRESVAMMHERTTGIR